MSKVYLSAEQCVTRFPILTRNLQWVLIGSAGEAGCVIRDYRCGLGYSCEACSHSGLTPKERIQQAIKMRHVLREQRKREGVDVLGSDRPYY